MNLLSIDFEDWYQGLTSTSERYSEWPSFDKRLPGAADWLLGALDAHKVRASFFIVGQVARDHSDIVRAIAAAGHEIGLHGDMHRHLGRMSREVFREDLRRNKDIVESTAGCAATGFRAPCFSVSPRTDWVWDELARASVAYDSSVFPIRNPLYGIPNAPRWPYRVETPNGNVLEVPITTVRCAGINIPFSGGFYFRVLPYAVVRGLARRVAAAGRPVVFYFHPWEFDPDHPRPDCVTPRERLSHYGGLTSARAKFLRLLEDFRFSPIAELLRDSRAPRNTPSAA